jgi:fatty acid/phospholipid biosynthesis enzyme
MSTQSDEMTLAVDVMGADNGTNAFVRGILYAANNFPSEFANIALVGCENNVSCAVSERALERFLKNKHCPRLAGGGNDG